MAHAAAAGLRAAAVLWAKGKSAGVSETSFCGLQRERGGDLVSWVEGRGGGIQLGGKGRISHLSCLTLNNQMNEGLGQSWN